MRVTHRFHPLFGRDFEFVAHRQNWGEDRVHLRDEDGELFSLPAGWTDVAPADPFAVIADGRCPFTIDGLLALADLIGRLRSLPEGDAAVKENYAVIVKEITPVIPASTSPSERASSSHLAIFLVFSRFLRCVAATAFLNDRQNYPDDHIDREAA